MARLRMLVPTGVVVGGAAVRNAMVRMSATGVDVALAIGVGATMVLTEVTHVNASGEPLVMSSVTALIVASASLAVLDRLPLVTAVAVAVATPVYYMFGPVDSWIAWLAFAAAVIRLGARDHRLSMMTAAALALTLFTVGEVIRFEPLRYLAIVAWHLVALAAGEIARSRRAYLQEVERRAVEAERGREEEARRRASEERLRIARELHDVIAHSISLMNVQAGAAAHRRDPEQAYAALEAIKEASKDTLRELRSTLGVLRQVDGDATPVAPVPSLTRLDALVGQTVEAGLPVRLVVNGEEAAAADPPPTPGRPLATTVSRSAYRIVQEALTNAVRHAGAESATVAVDHGADEVVVTVDDDGRGAAGGTVEEGNGLRGMRERVAAVGGELVAGPRPDGGFRVRAALPRDGSAGAPRG